MEINGHILQVLPAQTGVNQNGNTWIKQEYILQTSDRYPKTICYTLWGDRVETERAEVGDAVRVQFDLMSREWNGRWYTEISAWRVTSPQAIVLGDAPSSEEIDKALGCSDNPAVPAATVPAATVPAATVPAATAEVELQPVTTELPF
jgi:hypothetical protein